MSHLLFCLQKVVVDISSLYHLHYSMRGLVWYVQAVLVFCTSGGMGVG